jgi:hypothetical protein
MSVKSRSCWEAKRGKRTWDCQRPLHFLYRYQYGMGCGLPECDPENNRCRNYLDPDCHAASYFWKYYVRHPQKGLLNVFPGMVYHTQDGGQTWSLNAKFSSLINDMFLCDSTQGPVGGHGSMIAAFGVPDAVSPTATRPSQDPGGTYTLPTQDGCSIYASSRGATGQEVHLRLHGAGLYFVRIMGLRKTYIRKVLVE